MTTSSSSNAPSGSPENRTLQVRSQAVPTDKPGQYGMRVFGNYQKRFTSLEDIAKDMPKDEFDKKVVQLGKASIRYSPVSNPANADALRDNALGYAEASIQAFDQDGDHALGQSDLETQLAKAAGIDDIASQSQTVQDFVTAQAQQYLKAVDLNEDGKITADEEAAQVFLSDNAPGHLARAYESMIETAATDADKQQLKETADYLKSIPSKVDGQITYLDRVAMESAIADNPNVAKTLMQLVSNSFDLPTHYQQLQQVWKQ